MARNIVILQGSIHNIAIERDDSTATSATFIMKNDDTNAVITVTDNYVDGTALIELTGIHTAVVGTYSYQINENTPDGKIKHGDIDMANLELGKVFIIESLDGAVS